MFSLFQQQRRRMLSRMTLKMQYAQLLLITLVVFPLGAAAFSLSSTGIHKPHRVDTRLSSNRWSDDELDSSTRRPTSERKQASYTKNYSNRNGDGRMNGKRTQNEERRPRRRESEMDQRYSNDAEPVYASYLATCLPGMAGILQDELISMGCITVEPSGKSAVHFGVSNLETVLRVLLWTRTAIKVMELLTTTQEPVYTRDDIYQFVRQTVPVQDLLGKQLDGSNQPERWSTVSVSVTLNNAKCIPVDINHSHYTALNVKNALVDAARDLSKDDSRPSVDTDDADVPLSIVLRGIPAESPRRAPYTFANGHNRAEGSGDSSGDRTSSSSAEGAVARVESSAGAHMSIYRCLHIGSLHRRGYRYGGAVHKAAMKESTAAGLLLAAGWHKTSQQEKAVLVDPMMGSGTFLLEGAMIAADLAPGLMRIKCGVPAALDPPIIRWSHDDLSASDVEVMWNGLLSEATVRAKQGLKRLVENNIKIVGNDIHGGACDLADAALQQAGLSKVVQINCNDCLLWKVDCTDTTPWTVVSNPPWGVRLSDDMHESWEALRVFLRERSPACSEAWILSGSPEATKHLGLRRSQSLPIQTGEQDLRWLQYMIRDKTITSDSDNVKEERPHISQGEVPESRNRGQNNRVASRDTTERPKRMRTLSSDENEWLI